jgi:hypothetical protein
LEKKFRYFSLFRPALLQNDFICDKYEVAKILSLPKESDEFDSDDVDSYRTYKGVLHNPSVDTRRTKHILDIIEGNPTVPSDKEEIPKLHLRRWCE